jgi:hypothetical protein
MRFKILCSLAFSMLLVANSNAQKLKPRLKDLSLETMESFQSPTDNWKIIGDVQGSFGDTLLNTAKGKGILLNNYTKSIQNQSKYNLFTKLEHGDIYIEFDLMIPKGSNSGIYLQSRYEVQINDSWGVKIPTFSDMGGIYERWKDDKGFEGNAPLKNAASAPGLWQHMEISFQAPRFDASGKKTMPAKFNFVKLNGIILHENIFVSGPTRVAVSEKETAVAPLMIQGDHGMIAIKNIKYAPQDDLKATLTDLNYKYFENSAKTPEQASKTKPTSQGVAKNIDSRLASAKDKYFIQFEGKLNVPTKDAYLFTTYFTGDGSLEIDGKTVIPTGWTRIGADPFYGTTELEAGTHTLKFWVSKEVNWARSGMSLYIEKANSKAVALNAPASIPERGPAPLIAVRSEKEPEIIRSFMMHKNKKLTHVMSVGDPSQMHYSYDLMQGGMLQVWKGDFLNATDMWYERGEPQTATALGAPIVMAGNCPIYEKTNKQDSVLDYQYKGYTLNELRQPTFNYAYKTMQVQDKITPNEKLKGLNRVITVNGEGKEKLMIRIAQGNAITPLGSGLYGINNQAYFIQIAPGIVPKIESYNNQLVLLLPAAEAIQYQIIW